MFNDTGVPGAKIVNVDGKPALAIGSRRLDQQDIERVTKVQDIIGVLFYTPTFDNVDLSILSNLGLKKLAFLHGNFGDQELRQIERLEDLALLKILGTNVSDAGVQRFKENCPQVEVKYTA